jgi:hypothetical protein
MCEPQRGDENEWKKCSNPAVAQILGLDCDSDEDDDAEDEEWVIVS